ncbi:hypothetical protein PV325_005168 [Microctonus aethiopoides]|nr:hypothetical protein PV325_005168 [Microctonus aethiopoides]
MKALKYADDIAVIAEEPKSLKKMLQVMEKYIGRQKLSVNTKKTKIVVFKNGGRRGKEEKWEFKGEELQEKGAKSGERDVGGGGKGEERDKKGKTVPNGNVSKVGNDVWSGSMGMRGNGESRKGASKILQIHIRGSNEHAGVYLEERTRGEGDKGDCKRKAPGTYYPEDVYLDKGPQYTLGGKLSMEKTNNVPAPGTYYPEKYYSDSSPKYSFGLKTFLSNANDNPAPGTYHIKNGNMDKAPQYSFGIRTVHGTSLNTPAAPDTYFPEKLNMNLGPEFSLSGNSSINKLNEVPGNTSFLPLKVYFCWPIESNV